MLYKWKNCKISSGVMDLILLIILSIYIHLDEPRFSELYSCRLYCELPHLNLDITLVKFGVFPSPAVANIFDFSIMMDFMEHLISLRKQNVKRQTAGSETAVMQSKSRGEGRPTLNVCNNGGLLCFGWNGNNTTEDFQPSNNSSGFCFGAV